MRVTSYSCKLLLILRSKAVNEVPLTVGEAVEVYQKKEHEKRDKWSDFRPILSINHDARSLKVPGRRGREVTVAFEDVRPAIQQQSFTHMVQDGIDALGELTIEAPGTFIEQNMSNSLENSNANDADFSSDSAQIESCVEIRSLFLGHWIKSITVVLSSLKKAMVVWYKNPTKGNYNGDLDRRPYREVDTVNRLSGGATR